MPEPTPIPVDQLHFAMPPVHTSLEEERAYRRERLAGALRLFGEYGYEDGVSGHITARDPEFTDCFWVNPFGAPFEGLRPDELILVNGEGQVVEGRHHVNQAAFAVHAQVHRARPDVVAVAHTHSVHGRALAALGSSSSRSPRSPAPSTRTTPSTTRTRASSWTRTRGAGSPPRSAAARRSSCATTDC